MTIHETPSETSAPMTAPPANRGALASPAEAPAAPAPTGVPMRAWISLVLMIVIIAGAGYLMFQRLFGRAGDTRELVDIVRVRGGGGGGLGAGAWNAPREPADGVREIGRDSYQVKAGESRLNIRQPKPGEWALNFSYQKPDLIPADQNAALSARFRLPRDPAFAKSLGVTAEQIKQLDALPGREGMVITDADRARARDLFEAYRSAAPPRAEQSAALVAALKDIGEKSLEPTRATLAERAAKVREILTPEQLAKFTRPGT